MQIYSNATLPVNLEILSLSPLLVSEGKHVLVTNENIAMVLDIAKYGVEESNVVFTLVISPIYGTLGLDLLTSRSDHSFTLQDINQDKVIDQFIKFSNSRFINSRIKLRLKLLESNRHKSDDRDECRDISVHLSLTRVTIKLEIAEEFAGTRVRGEIRSGRASGIN